MKYVIIGTGVAGIAAIEAIRSVDANGEIIMIGDDPHGFYSRPGLAYYLTGEVPDKQLFPQMAEEFRKLHFHYIKGHVTRILPAASRLDLKDASSMTYGRLLLAIGARATPLTVPGAELPGVVKLDHLDDARQILKYARRGKTAVVVGGGITALELTEGLVARGVKVHYLLRGDRYWSNVLDAHESHIIENRLKEEGVQLHFHAEVIEVQGQDSVKAVRLLDGRVLRCDMVAYAIGIQPRLELAREAGIAVDRGVLVNQFLESSVPGIYAAGDVAQVYDPVAGRSVLDSLWGPARDQGYTAGLNMAGHLKAYHKTVPFNVTRLAGLTTTIIGAVGHGRDDDLVGIARGDSETWRELPHAMIAQSGEVNRLRLLVGERTLVGAIVMGDQKLSMPLEKMIAGGADVSSVRDELLAPGAPIADIISTYWLEWSRQHT
ncbi:MAG: NAD(P)/FAD-dependent oxidoreductase [Chloroflexi bacterium]|nr:NAD(P)/FAD-dependent oxidoreductase [Chloroflexota bacterium]